MIEFIKGSVSEISDWSGIGVFYAIELTRQRAFVILSDPSDGATPIESKISELSPPKNNDEMEMLEVLYGQLHIEEVLRSLDPNLLNADYSSPKSNQNPYGKIWGVIPNINQWLIKIKTSPSMLKKNGFSFRNPLRPWKNVSGKNLAIAYRAWKEFKEEDDKIREGLEAEVRAGWKVERRNIKTENKETVWEHTEAGIRLILRYKEMIREELGINWVVISDMISAFRIHDYPEAYIGLGDIADSNKSITPEEKARRTREAAEIIFGRFGEKGKYLMQTWETIETAKSGGARLLKEVDKIQAVEQALHYERQGGNCFLEIFDGEINRGLITFNTTKRMMLDIGAQYMEYLEESGQLQSAEKFQERMNTVSAITISSGSSTTSFPTMPPLHAPRS